MASSSWVDRLGAESDEKWLVQTCPRLWRNAWDTMEPRNSSSVDGISSLRVDMAREISMLRTDFTRDLSEVRVELKWSFLFWVGQVAAVAGLLAFMRH
jgi:hypothetical protein